MEFVCHDILEHVIGANCLTIHNDDICSRLPNWTAQQMMLWTTHISPSTSQSFSTMAVANLQWQVGSSPGHTVQVTRSYTSHVFHVGFWLSFIQQPCLRNAKNICIQFSKYFNTIPICSLYGLKHLHAKTNTYTVYTHICRCCFHTQRNKRCAND